MSRSGLSARIAGYDFRKADSREPRFDPGGEIEIFEQRAFVLGPDDRFDPWPKPAPQPVAFVPASALRAIRSCVGSARRTCFYTYSVPVPPNLYSSTFASVGTIDNSGIELTIASTPVTTRNFRWDLGATVSHNRNELVRFSNDQYEMVEIKTGYFADDLKMYTMRIVEGEPLGNFWGPKFLGFDAAGGAVYEDLDGASLRFVGEYPETCRKDVALRTFYWDYVIVLLLFSTFLGGVVFKASNILLAAAVALCGMSVAFPVGVGLALVLGVLINYFGAAKGDPLFIFPWRGAHRCGDRHERSGIQDGPDRETETCGERASDLGRGGHDHGLFSTGLSPLRWTSTVSRRPQPER